MTETVQRQLRACLEAELEALGAGNPIEDPDSTHRLKVFLLNGENGNIKATSCRVGPDGHHDLSTFLAALDVNLQSDEYLVAQCLQRYFNEEIPTDDNGGVLPGWPIDPFTLVQAHEDAWELHCNQRIDEWVDDALAQIQQSAATKR